MSRINEFVKKGFISTNIFKSDTNNDNKEDYELNKNESVEQAINDTINDILDNKNLNYEDLIKTIDLDKLYIIFDIARADLFLQKLENIKLNKRNVMKLIKEVNNG